MLNKRGRPKKKPEDRITSYQKSLYLTKHEHEMLISSANSMGISASAFIRASMRFVYKNNLYDLVKKYNSL